MTVPRLVIAGTHSGVGKTTVTMGLLHLLRQDGLRVQPFKAGPDYIDPQYHTAVAGRPCRTLDMWLMPPRRLPGLVARACAGTDLALVEGVMGLHDGIGATSEQGSTAALAKRLDCPVLLVLDAGPLSRSAAAIVRGYMALDPSVRIRGVFLNRVAGQGHARLVTEAIERLTGVPVLGWLPREGRLALPERHLGLVPSSEGRRWRAVLGPLAAQLRAHSDVAAIRRLAGEAGPLDGGSGSADVGRRRGGRRAGASAPLIGVARDAAFNFYYPENLELLESYGARLVPFSPLTDRRLPAGLSALYLGGGFPEVFAPALARNRALRAALRARIAAGVPTYAECGGLMYLARGIRAGCGPRGRRWPMLGILPWEVRMTDRLQSFGYTTVAARRRTVFTQPGEAGRGHEFHHSVCDGGPSPATAAYTATARHGGAARAEGYGVGSLVASYIHVHWYSQPRWAARFVAAAGRRQV